MVALVGLSLNFIDNPVFGEGIDVYRDGTHMLRIDNAGNVHVYYGKILVYRNDVEIKGNIHVNGSLDVRGDLYIQGGISTRGDCTVGGTLKVGGDIMLYGDIIQNTGCSATLSEPDPPTSPLSPLPGFPNLDNKPSF